MKLTIKDGRDHFYTFDTNRILLLTATDEEQINQVEFSTEENGETVSWTSDVLTGEDGIKFVQVPNEFLNGNYSRLVCYYVALDSKGEFTRQKEVFRIRARQEPEDYFLTYSERVTFASIKALTEQYKVNASNSADLARRYAEESEDVNVEAGTYSSKHWSAKSEKKFQEIKDYVGSTSDPESALGSIESARASAVSDVNKQKTDSIEAVRTYTSNTAIPSVSQYVESTAKPALKTYGEQQVNSYVNGTSKPELDRYVNNEKKQVLDNYTSEKKSELDNYTETDKKQILDSYTENEKKAELDSHAEGLKGQLNIHTVTKTGELNEYTTGLKSELDGYTTAKEQDISEFTEQKKLEVQGVYQTDLNELKGDLDTERNARIESDTDHSTRLQKVEVASSVNRYEIDNLKAKAEGKLYRTETVDAEAYTVDVPSSIAPYAEVQRIGGKSVVWNSQFSFLSSGSLSSEGVYSSTLSSDTPVDFTYHLFGSKSDAILNGHKLLLKYVDVTNTTGMNLYLNTSPNWSNYNVFTGSGYVYLTANYGTSAKGVVRLLLYGKGVSGGTVSGKFSLLDLTQMFGSGNEPTEEECKNIFSAEYYPFDAGTIKSFPVKKVRSVGRNLYNVNSPENTVGYGITASTGAGSVNSSLTATPYIHVKEGETYYLLNTLNGTGAYGTAFYDSSKNYISGVIHNHSTSYKSVTVPTGAVYMRTTVLNSSKASVCINVSDAKNGTFTPYMESTIDLSSVTSDFKSAGSVHDEWSNGKKIIRVGERAYTSGDESESSVITDGTTTYYPLATPTEETVPEIDNYIQVEAGGTLTFESDDTVHMPVPSTDRFVVDLS